MLQFEKGDFWEVGVEYISSFFNLGIFQIIYYVLIMLILNLVVFEVYVGRKVIGYLFSKREKFKN